MWPQKFNFNILTLFFWGGGGSKSIGAALPGILVILTLGIHILCTNFGPFIHFYY